MPIPALNIWGTAPSARYEALAAPFRPLFATILSQAAEADQTRGSLAEAIEQLSALGLPRWRLPPQYGGHGASLVELLTLLTEADIVAFGGISGDFFYMHFDELAAKQSQFGKRIAHGYFVLSAAAGLFVWPGVGPVLANYGLDNLRFVAPVAIGDTIRARLTCKRKVDRQRCRVGQGGDEICQWCGVHWILRLNILLHLRA